MSASKLLMRNFRQSVAHATRQTSQTFNSMTNSRFVPLSLLTRNKTTSAISKTKPAPPTLAACLNEELVQELKNDEDDSELETSKKQITKIFSIEDNKGTGVVK